MKVGEPRFGVFAKDHASHVNAGEGNLVRRVQERDVGPQGVVDDAPSDWKHRVLHAQILAVLDEGPVRLENDEAAIHVFEQVKLALEDVVSPVGKVLILVGIRKFVLDYSGAGVGQPRGRDDPELLDFARQEDGRGSQKKRIYGFQRILRIEPLEEDGGRGDDLLPKLELFPQRLDEAGKEYDDFLVLFLGQALEIHVPLSQQIHPVQQPLRAMRTLPKVSSHGLPIESRGGATRIGLGGRRPHLLPQGNEMVQVLMDGVRRLIRFRVALALEVGGYLVADAAPEESLGEFVDERPAGLDDDAGQVLDFDENAFHGASGGHDA